MNKNELTTTNNGFSSLMEFNLSDAMSEELFGLDGGFEKIKIPAGGSTIFEVPGETPGEFDSVKEFSAVILHHHPLHTYYKDKYTGGNQIPDCGSFDGVIGNGIPGGYCAKCQYNQFGSGENGGKLCKSKRRIYVLREGEIFPLLLTLPTGSIKEFGTYIKRLITKGKKSHVVVTKFSLKKVTNSGGIAYAQAQFSVDRVLSEQEQVLISKLKEHVKDYSTKVGFEEVDSINDNPFDADTDTGEVVVPIK